MTRDWCLVGIHVFFFVVILFHPLCIGLHYIDIVFFMVMCINVALAVIVIFGVHYLYLGTYYLPKNIGLNVLYHKYLQF